MLYPLQLALSAPLDPVLARSQRLVEDIGLAVSAS
jgi:hypothetical protein